MTTTESTSLARAERFVLLNARLIDRLRFQYLFRGGSGAAVAEALTPYANDDGGFGNALEPDLRGRESQPQPVEVAFHVMDDIAGDVPFDGPLVRRACDFLLSVATGEGGVPFVLPTVGGTPSAPWWLEAGDFGANLNPTAALAGLLHKHRVDHPFLAGATRFCWTAIEAATDVRPYDAFAVLLFLDHVPDRHRAEEAFDRLAPLMREHITADLEAPGHVHRPLDFAPRPDGFGRRLVGDDLIDAHLDAVARAQDGDGAWRPTWPIWAPVTRFEWSGVVTISTLSTLRAYGRL
jgi:hypothetical protein